MASRLRPAWCARLAVGAAALGAAALGAAPAQAAMGGGLPLVTASRPDLTTVTLVSSTTVQYCFDKTLGQSVMLKPASFMLGGYRARGDANTSSNASFAPTTVVYDLSKTSCVDATFPSKSPSGATIDYNQYTYGSVAAGSVKSLSGAQPNDADSTGLAGSSTHNGTTGATVAPDLTGVTVDRSHNIVNYVFDKNIGGVGVAPGSGFFIVDPGGNICRQTTAVAITFSANVVSVVFPAASTGDCPPPFAAGPSSVGNAVRAGLDRFVVDDATVGQAAEPNVDTQVAIVPGTSGTTARPDLISAALEPDGSTIDYNFDQPIASVVPADFDVILADDAAEGGASAVISNAATTGSVRVAFTDGSTFNEYDVKATALVGAVTALNSLLDSTYGSVPIGDNAGAFARGFTSGPDALGVSWSKTTGDATVTFDQRVFSNSGSFAPNPGGFVLLDANGTPVAAGGGQNVNFVPAAAGPMQVTVHFSPSAFTTAKALEICGPPDNLGAITPPSECANAAADSGSVWTSALGGAPEAPNIQQILSPFATSAVLTPRGRAHAKWHHARRTTRRQLLERSALTGRALIGHPRGG